MIPTKAFDVAEVQKTQPKPPVSLGCRELQQPIGDKGIFIVQAPLVPVTGFTDRKRVTGLSDAHPIVLNGRFCHLSSLKWLYHFFAIASWMISTLSFSSAYIFFSRRFSSSYSSLSRAISEASIPPNLARHL